MKNVTRIMTIPGLSGARKLEQRREESMRFAQMNLDRQTRSRIAISMLGQMQTSKLKTIQK